MDTLESSSFFLTLSPLHWVDRAALSAEAAVQQIRGRSNNPERRIGKNILVHYIARSQCGFNRDAATAQKI